VIVEEETASLAIRVGLIVAAPVISVIIFYR
jgi:hypothetical protein